MEVRVAVLLKNITNHFNTIQGAIEGLENEHLDIVI